MNLMSRFIATFLGIGYSPVAPGTMGALALVILYWILPPLSVSLMIGITVLITLVGVFCASVIERDSQKKFGTEKGQDPGIIVIDEVAGMLVALIAVPKTIHFVIAAFILFRIFDIAKPFPVNKFEKIHSGWGIILDDIMAGVYANVILQVVRIFL